MRHGELYRVRRPSARDPRPSRVFVVVSRQAVLDSRFLTAVCAPIYSQHDALASQVRVGIAEGLKHESTIHCDELVSLPKAYLTDYVGALSTSKLDELADALKAALEVE